MTSETAPTKRITADDPLTLDEEYREVEFKALPEWAQELRLQHELDQFWAGPSYVETQAARFAAEDTTTL